jgi:hypothetical protein
MLGIIEPAVNVRRYCHASMPLSAWASTSQEHPTKVG